MLDYWSSVLGLLHWDLQEDFNMQWYPPNGGGFQHDCTANGASAQPECVRRVLAWMTYLNDIEEGGETFFEVQQCKVRPKKGLTSDLACRLDSLPQRYTCT
jgi:prolyl 4-hydroxylase